MSHVNIVKKVKIGERWRLLAIPKTGKGNPDWSALPEGRYYIEWYLAGKRRRGPAGITAAEALEAQRRKKHDLDGRELGIKGFEHAGEEGRKAPLHVAIARYLGQVETLKKPNTLRKYRAVLERFLEHFATKPTVDAITAEDLNDFIVWLMKKQRMSPNTVLHNIVIIAQFFKRQGRPNITRELDLPGRITGLPREYSEEDLSRFFAVCMDWERVLFSCFLFTGMRDQEMAHLMWEGRSREASPYPDFRD